MAPLQAVTARGGGANTRRGSVAGSGGPFVVTLVVPSCSGRGLDVALGSGALPPVAFGASPQDILTQRKNSPVFPVALGLWHDRRVYR